MWDVLQLTVWSFCLWLHNCPQMLMEAVMASLKDLEMNVPPEDSTRASKTDSFGSSHVGDPETSSTTITCGASKTESTSSSTVHGQDLASDHPSPRASVSSPVAVAEVPPSNKRKDEESTTRPESSGDALIQSNEEADVSGKTKATLTVVKNPTSHILDGLVRRWDLNCFRSRSNW